MIRRIALPGFGALILKLCRLGPDTAARWMLLCDRFCEKVYTPFDSTRGTTVPPCLRQAKVECDRTSSDMRSELQRHGERLTAIARQPLPPLACWENHQTLDECLLELERAIIVRALSCTVGNRAQAARLLGVRPNTLHYKMKRLGIEHPPGCKSE